MFRYIFASIYLWLRPLMKWVLRRTTRLCELQRICYGELDGASRAVQVEYSLHQSRNKDIKKAIKHLDSKASDCKMTEDEVLYVSYTITRVKEIRTHIHKKWIKMLAHTIAKIWGYRQLIAQVEHLRGIAYDSENEEHEKKLLKLWSLLMPEIELKDRISKQWQEIGFQGNDPKTDFRGMGILGLENLLFFAETHTNAARHVLMRSQHPKYGYSMAIVGINITSLAYHLLEDMTAKSHFYNLSKAPPDMKTFHQFYCYLLYKFDFMWRQEKPKDIMEFNRIRNKFEENMRLKLKDLSMICKCDFVLENI